MPPASATSQDASFTIAMVSDPQVYVSYDHAKCQPRIEQVLGGAQRGLTDPAYNRRAGPPGTRPMVVTDSFVAFVLEQLDPLGPIASKRMFGGVGLYAGDLFFALIAGDVLYLKADEATRDAREKAGARPFQPFPDRPRGKGRTQYYSVPAAILEDADALLAWAKEAVAIAGANS